MSVYSGIPRQLTTLINGIVVLCVAAKDMLGGWYARIFRGKDTYEAQKEISQ
jgi:hypothetical protein